MELENICANCEKVTALKVRLDQSNAHFMDVLNNSRDILYKYDFLKGTYDYISPSVENFTGFTSDEVIEFGVNLLLEILHPNDREMFLDFYNSLINNEFEGSEITLEYRTKKKDGSYIWRQDNIKVLRNEQDNICGIVGNARDITETKKLENRLLESERNYKSLYHDASVALYRTRASDGKLLECNDKLAELFGYESKEDCLKNFYAVKHYIDVSQRQLLIDRLNKESFIDGFEARLKKLNGEIIWIRLSARLDLAKGCLDGAVFDITELKKLTDTERSVLKMIVEGRSNKKIADELDRSVRTVEDHRGHIMNKLGVHNAVELTRKAMEMGLENL